MCTFYIVALPIVAGVVTAVLLTAILIITVCCLRKRYRKPQHSSPESTVTTATTCTALPAPPLPHNLQSMGSMRGIQVATTLRRDQSGQPVVHTLPYHRLQCNHAPNGAPIVDFIKPDPNYVPDSSFSHFRPLVASSETGHSSSPSTVQSDVSVTDSEFHTIRECLGDFKNNNSAVPNSQGQLQQTLPNNFNQQHQFVAQVHQPAFGGSMTAPRVRMLWTADGRPYEAVTCEHGVEHIYQPLEHIYEEPHIWTRPLPNH